MDSISNIFLKLSQDWGQILGFSVSIEDTIYPSKLQSHLLWSVTLKHGYVINTDIFIRGGRISKILQSGYIFNDSNIDSHDNSSTSFSFYFYCDSLAFRRGAQPYTSNFTYPFVVNKHILNNINNSNVNLFIRGRGGLNFNKLFSLLGTDIGYLGSFLNSKLDPHLDILVFQFGIVDFARYRNSGVYKLANFFYINKILDFFFFNYFFIKKFNKLLSYLKLINGNYRAFIYSIGSFDNKYDPLLRRINAYIYNKGITNYFYIDTSLLSNECYLDEGHLTEKGHKLYAEYLIRALDEFIFNKVV